MREELALRALPIRTAVRFRITPATGAYKVVFNFDYTSTGVFPSGLTIAPDGTFYGLASATTGEILFHYTPATGTFQSTALNFPLFNGLPSNPSSGLILGPNGNLYGLYHIYETDGLGVFEVRPVDSPDGSNLQLFPFYNTIDGGGSPDGLMLASDGNFWMAITPAAAATETSSHFRLPMGRCSRCLHLSAHRRRLAPIQA
jgi:hypothetical protein